MAVDLFTESLILKELDNTKITLKRLTEIIRLPSLGNNFKRYNLHEKYIDFAQFRIASKAYFIFIKRSNKLPALVGANLNVVLRDYLSKITTLFTAPSEFTHVTEFLPKHYIYNSDIYPLVIDQGTVMKVYKFLGTEPLNFTLKSDYKAVYTFNGMAGNDYYPLKNYTTPTTRVPQDFDIIKLISVLFSRHEVGHKNTELELLYTELANSITDQEKLSVYMSNITKLTKYLQYTSKKLTKIHSSLLKQE